jgi:hypothetical protein
MVDTDLKWIDLNNVTPKVGTKVLLINKNLGSATHGKWEPGTLWTHWFPFPTFDSGGDSEKP